MFEAQESFIGKVFISGHSQALRLPKAVRFSKDVKEVEITRRGNELIIRPKKRKMTQKQWRVHWQKFFANLSHEDNDFMNERPLNRPFKPRDIF